MVSLCLTFVLYPLALDGVASESDLPAMKGLNAVQVTIETLSVGARKLGINEAELRTDVELKLRLAGMAILEKSGAGEAVLYVNVNISEEAGAANIDVALKQDVFLFRDRSITVALATTWDTGVVMPRPDRFRIRESVKDATDTFLNLWLQANPRSR